MLDAINRDLSFDSPKKNMILNLSPHLFDFLAHPTESLSWQHFAVFSWSLCIQVPCERQSF